MNAGHCGASVSEQAHVSFTLLFLGGVGKVAECDKVKIAFKMLPTS